MASKLEIINKEQLEALHTGTLMNRRKALLKCEESLEASDQGVNSQTQAGYIEFKNTQEWQQAYTELKEVLSARENIPNKQERKAVRQAKARASK